MTVGVFQPSVGNQKLALNLSHWMPPRRSVCRWLCITPKPSGRTAGGKPPRNHSRAVGRLMPLGRRTRLSSSRRRGLQFLLGVEGHASKTVSANQPVEKGSSEMHEDSRKTDRRGPYGLPAAQNIAPHSPEGSRAALMDHTAQSDIQRPTACPSRSAA